MPEETTRGVAPLEMHNAILSVDLLLDELGRQGTEPANEREISICIGAISATRIILDDIRIALEQLGKRGNQC